MKDGRTHLAHKVEHAADMKTGAILAVTVQGADRGDTTTIEDTMIEAARQMETLAADPESKLPDDYLSEIVADKGYHSNDTMTAFKDLGIRSYISEPDRGRRNWKGKPAEQQAVYANRRRIRGERGKRLLRQRGLMLERPFAHTLETGAMRRVHLRHRDNILKRILIQYADVESEPDSSEQFRERHTARPSGPVCCCLVHPDTALEPLSIALFRS